MSIQRRTVTYIKPTGKQMRLTGWARTTTTLGTCWEPFEMGLKHVAGDNYADFDPSEMMSRVDDFKQVDTDDYYDGDGANRKPIHGGNPHPVTQPVTGKF